jgi:antitoxin MazE
MRVAKWGNSLARRLPAAVVEALELKEGDEVEMLLAGPRLSTSTTTEAANARWRAFRASGCKLLPDWKFDPDDANFALS